MTRRLILNLHLYSGLILMLTILSLSITGIYLNHQHDWFHKQNIHYINLNYESIVNQAIYLENQERKNVPEAVARATEYGLFTLSSIQSVNYATHGLGYFYYVHLNDDKNTIVVVTEDGEIAKSYSDPPIKKWMRDLHIGTIESINFVLINDITTVGLIFLTVSGYLLSTRILKARKIQKQKRDSH